MSLHSAIGSRQWRKASSSSSSSSVHPAPRKVSTERQTSVVIKVPEIDALPGDEEDERVQKAMTRREREELRASRLAQMELEKRFERELEIRREKKHVSQETRAEVEAEIASVRKRLSQIYNNNGYVLNPDTALMQYWGLLMLSCILICTVWTPYEVAFLNADLDVRFAINRVIDLVFFLDFVSRFFRAFPHPITGQLVRDHKSMALRYARRRMLLDLLLSVGACVCDSLALLRRDEGPVSNAYAGDPLEAVRLLRLTHITKVSSLAKCASIHFGLMDGSKWTYNQLALGKFIMVIAVVVHLMSCSWRLVIAFERDHEDFADTWIMREGLLYEPPLELYVTCVYWATTTITTIGYGDLANPGTSLERAVSVLVMICGALVWAYIIGGVTAVVSSFNQEELEFSEQMDQLNRYMAQKHMSKPLRERLRSFFVHRRSLERDNGYSCLLEKMSPTLRGEVARTVSHEWLRRVPWLNNGSLGFIASVAIALQHELFAPQEVIAGTQLRVLTRGVVAKNSRIYTRGSVWGIDIILTSPTLKNLQPARALTFSHLLSLDSKSLEELLMLYPRERSRIRASAIWLGLRRSFVNYAQQMKTGRQIIHRIAEEAQALAVDVKMFFKAFDVRGRETLSETEFDHAIRTLGYTGPAVLLDVIMSRFDKDGDGSVNYPEFINYFLHEYAFDSAIEAQDKHAYIEHLDFRRLTAVKSLQDSLKEEDFVRQVRKLHAKGSRPGLWGPSEGSDNFEARFAADSNAVPSALSTDGPSAGGQGSPPGGAAIPGLIDSGPNGADTGADHDVGEVERLASKNDHDALPGVGHSMSGSPAKSTYRGNPKRAKASTGKNAADSQRETSVLVRLVNAHTRIQRATPSNEPSMVTEMLAGVSTDKALSDLPISEQILNNRLDAFRKQLLLDMQRLLAQSLKGSLAESVKCNDGSDSEDGSCVHGEVDAGL